MRAEEAEIATCGPYFDTGRTSRTLCILGLALSWLVGVCCFAVGVALTVHREFIHPKKYTMEFVSLGLNFLLTICNESLGYIHTVSLRWTLQREHRLEFNTNLRLVTSSRTSGPNRLHNNLLMLVCVMATYSSSSLIFIGSGLFPTRQVCGPAIIALGCAICGQCVFATWSWRSSVQAPTWSSGPLDTAAACLSQYPGLIRRPGRCMLGVHQRSRPTAPTLPCLRQPTARKAHVAFRTVLLVLWLVVGWELVMATFIFGVIKSDNPNYLMGITDGDFWGPFPHDSDVSRWSFDSRKPEASPALSFGWGLNILALPLPADFFTAALIFITVVQGVLTFCLHLAELCVNVDRDESTWRMATSSNGMKRNTNALISFLTSWQALALFSWKAVIHWMYGQSITLHWETGVVMRPVQMFYLSAALFLLAGFSTWVTSRRRTGPQPATFGHLQTLVELIDEWPHDGERMYWGHKGDKNGIGYAGTSAHRLDKIKMNMSYLGRMAIDLQYSSGREARLSGKNLDDGFCKPRRNFTLPSNVKQRLVGEDRFQQVRSKTM